MLICTQNHLVFRISGFICLIRNFNILLYVVFTKMKSIYSFRFIRKFKKIKMKLFTPLTELEKKKIGIREFEKQKIIVE